MAENIVASAVKMVAHCGAMWLCSRTQYCSPVHCVSTSTHRRVSLTLKSGGHWSTPISSLSLSRSLTPSTTSAVKMAKIWGSKLFHLRWPFFACGSLWRLSLVWKIQQITFAAKWVHLIHHHVHQQSSRFIFTFVHPKSTSFYCSQIFAECQSGMQCSFLYISLWPCCLVSTHFSLSACQCFWLRWNLSYCLIIVNLYRYLLLKIFQVLTFIFWVVVLFKFNEQAGGLSYFVAAVTAVTT